MKVFRLDCFVCYCDIMGNLLEIIIKEVVVFDMLLDLVKELLK